MVYRLFIAVMGMSTGLEHTGGVFNPIAGVQGLFLKVMTSTVSEEGWVAVWTQGSERIAGHGASR